MRIPKYQRWKGGISQFSIDVTRKAILYDGGAYDTYVTYDGGSSWETIFDMKMYFIDGASGWTVDGKGNWYYEGVVYHDPLIHLVTEDAGKTIRYLIEDTTLVPFARYYEPRTYSVFPDALYMDTYDIGDLEPARRGIYVSCDAGKTWTVAAGRTAGYTLHQVADNTISLSDARHKLSEFDLCASTWKETDISNEYTYHRLRDSSLMLYRTPYDPFRVRPQGDTTVVVYATYVDPETDAVRPFIPRAATRLNDTLELILAKDGVIATYGLNAGLQFIDRPPLRNPYQQVVNVGQHGDRLLLETLSPLASPDSTVRWTMLNTRTGEHTTTVHPGSAFVGRSLYYWAAPLLQNTRIIPVTDSMWLFAPEAGELMRTSNAGGTWTMVDNINRDERWGLHFVSALRLFDRGNNTMAVLTENQRFMLRDSATDQWYISHMGPFTHSLHVVNGTTAFTHTELFYHEDLGGALRCRYGPSTAFFQKPDTIWMSGDAVTRWTPKGEYIDTVLHRKARVIKRVAPNIIVAAMDSVWLTFNEGKHWTYVSKHWPEIVHGQDTAKAALGDMILAMNGELVIGLRGTKLLDTLGNIVDSIPGGIIRSIDSGNTWTSDVTGIPNNVYVSSLLMLESGTLLALAADITLDPTIIDDGPRRRTQLDQCYREAYRLGQAYIYRSIDNGHTWTLSYIFPRREFMPSAELRLMHTPDGRALAIHPDVGIAFSGSDGNWFGVGDPLNIGMPLINDVVFTNDGWVHLATDSGYVRVRFENILDVKEQPEASSGLSTHLSTSHVLSITSLDFSPTSIQLLTLDGRTALVAPSSSLQNSAMGNVTELDVTGLPTGTYVVLASNAAEVRTTLVQIY